MGDVDGEIDAGSQAYLLVAEGDALSKLYASTMLPTVEMVEMVEMAAA